MDAVVTKYPDWQETIRNAQALSVAREALKEQNRIAAEEKQDIENARLLREALEYFGIFEAEPKRNRYELDGYVFSLGTKQYRDSEAVLEHNSGRVQFTLHVTKPLPAVISDAIADADYYPTWRTSGYISVYSMPTNGDWTEHLTGLATTLDDITAGYAEALEWYERYKVRKATPQPAVATPTEAEKLLALLRSLIAEEVNAALDR